MKDVLFEVFREERHIQRSDFEETMIMQTRKLIVCAIHSIADWTIN